MERQQDYVLRTVEERGVRLIRLWFTDVLGQLKSFAIAPAELENAFEEGKEFDGSSIDGFSRVQESDVLARPDPNTFELLPWADGEARMFCDIQDVDGAPFGGDPRQVLRRNLDRARERGFTFYAAPEMEFFYFPDGNSEGAPKPLDTASYFDLTTADVAGNLRKRTIQSLEAMGIPVEYSFHEDAPSQHEIDLRYTDALTMADNVMTFKLVVKEIALEAGVHATFMPKPLEGVQGSGMHTHFSLFEGDVNAFHDAGDEHGLSKVGRGFIAGLLHHATGDHRGHQPVGQLVQAVGDRVRGPDLHLVGPQQPVRGDQRPPREAGQGRVDPHRVPGPGPVVQPLPRLLRGAGRRPEGHRGELRPARRRRRPTSTSCPARSSWRRACGRCRTRCPTRSTSWRSPSSSPTRWVSTSSSGSCGTSGPEWKSYKAHVTQWERDRYFSTL